MKLFDKNSLVSQILLIIIIFNIIAIAVFTFYVLQQDRRNTIKNTEDSLQEIANEKAQNISLVMGQIAKETESLAKWTNEFIEAEDRIQLSPEYKIGKNGILYRESTDPYQRSTIFYPSTSELDEEAIKLINATERLDTVFQKMMDKYPYLQWAYIATEQGLLRVYPGAPTDFYDPGHRQKEDPFYTVANEKNNPERKTVWSRPYVDYLGTGWMITCSVPLYIKDRFIGVACVDVRLETIQEEFLADFRLGESGFAYLLENSGAIIYHPLFVPSGGDQGQMFLINIIENTDLNENYKAALKKVLSRREGVVSYRNPQQEKQSQLIAFTSVESLPWKLAVEINQKQYLTISNLEHSRFALFILSIILIYICLAIFLYRQYSRPFNDLITRAKKISEGNFDLNEPIYNYTEIETLSAAFNSMSVEIKEYTDNLIKKNREIQSIINGIGGLLMILNPELDIIAINDKSLDALGKTQDEVKGRKCYEVLVNGSEVCKGCKIVESLKTREKAYTRIAFNDDIFQNTYFPILTKENEAAEVVVHSQKITKRVMLEKELSQSEKMSEIGQLTSAIAHELKNPLAVIKGSAYLLKASKKCEDETVDMSIDTILQTTEYAEKVIYNLLEFSSPSKSKQKQSDVTKIIDQVILLTRRNSIHKSIAIETTFSPNPLFYFGDTEPLKHIFLNLISNAINAIEDGGKIIITGVRKKTGGCDSLILTVEDNGTGIDQEIQDKIFEPFFTTDETGSGSGMGLWITKIMIEKMQGSIELISKKGVGSKFIITLPMTKE